MRKILIFISVLSFGSVCSASIITVDDDNPADYNNIQAAIYDANDGDTIIVADGIYTGAGNKNLDFGGRAITVQSENGPEATIIDCQNNGRGFYFHTGEGLGSVVSGFTITNGYVVSDANGGAIYCSGSSPTIMECSIANNTAGSANGSHGRGGGIFCTLASSPEITGCILTNNIALGGGAPSASYAHNGYGGAISCTSGSNPEITACTISNNQAVGALKRGYHSRGGFAYGGAISCESGSNPVITDNTIAGNKAIGGAGQDGSLEGYATNGGDASGGAIYNDSLSEPVIEDCNISTNSALGGEGGLAYNHGIKSGDGGLAYGGGICACGGGAGEIKNCIITNNNSTGGKGGAAVEPSTDFAAGNGGSAYSGGIYGYSGEKVVQNCAIAGNLATGGRGGNATEASTPGGNGGYGYGGGVFFGSADNNDTIASCTLYTNAAVKGIKGNNTLGVDGHSYGGGVYSSIDVNFIIRDSIIWTNSAEYNTQIYLVAGSVSFSDIQYGYTGVGNINADPKFVFGPGGSFYLSRIAAGQALNSPCVDAGSDTAISLGMNQLTTRTDQVYDNGIVDMGYHYRFTCGSPDLNNDFYVDFKDFAILALQWQQTPGVPSADIAPLPGIVNEDDLARMFEYWLHCFVERAAVLQPSDNAVNVSPGATLSWSAGLGAVSHDIYFGTDANEVTNGTGDTYKGRQTSTTWDPCSLEFETKYYWRVDEVGPKCITKGSIWNFTTCSSDMNSFLVSWWKFDENQGTQALDSFDDNHGSIHGPTWTEGKINSALSFDGDHDYVGVGDKSSLEQQSFTLTFWARLNNPSGSFQGGIAKGKVFGSATEFSYKIDFDNSLARAGISNTSDVGFGVTAPITDTGWHMWAFTAGSNVITIYKDGVYQSSTSYTGTIDYSKDYNNFCIGAYTNGLYSFNGIIDDVRFYSRALTGAEILQIYQSVSP